MNKRQRITIQRGLVREAIGKLRAAEEYFGVEDDYVSGSSDDHVQFSLEVNNFEDWLFSHSGIA